MTPTLHQVDNYEVPEFVAARVAKQYDLTLEYARALVREAKRMLYVNVISDHATAPSARVDMAWHEMMLFTKFYKDFCDFLGGGFIHHDPTPPESIEEYMKGPYKGLSLAMDEEEGEAPDYTITKANYEKFLGEKPNPEYWP